ncbi:SDR family NAD(P)-dependent oxidoreductase, partial [Pseudomonas bubulae]
KKTGIKVSVLCPGITRTRFFDAANMNTDAIKQSTSAMTPEEVALYTVRALDKNRAIIIPGRRNRWITRLPRLLSRWMTRKIAASVNKSYCPR